MIIFLCCVNLYIEKGQHTYVYRPNEPVKKTVA
ncbi:MULTISPECIES: hypothetical protein [Staphylococcus]|nr:hypothetical protein [Staphylococcus saprophyticus]AVC42140.1 hypothetical protein AL528_13205 [Staphylococcus saprophyticus]MBN6091245.1 hypothetical protein [Staphylococcus saprophyticus]MBN6095435.1 hypothetical protein [Staphylococcus saprophyticus]MBN6098033.1 hypothetical protein [Staphylococcus saprophyticus]MBN6098905.1 hypothetical protein [Staphylococcus saprophyticus]